MQHNQSVNNENAAVSRDNCARLRKTLHVTNATACQASESSVSKIWKALPHEVLYDIRQHSIMRCSATDADDVEHISSSCCCISLNLALWWISSVGSTPWKNFTYSHTDIYNELDKSTAQLLVDKTNTRTLNNTNTHVRTHHVYLNPWTEAPSTIKSEPQPAYLRSGFYLRHSYTIQFLWFKLCITHGMHMVMVSVASVHVSVKIIHK